MGIVESWNNYERRVGQGIGAAAAVAAQNNSIVRSAVDATCLLARIYPDKWVAPPYTRAWVSTACSTSGQDSFPDVPQPQFRGGQCGGVEYRFTIDYEATQPSGSVTTAAFSGTIYGPVGEVFVDNGEASGISGTWLNVPGFTQTGAETINSGRVSVFSDVATNIQGVTLTTTDSSPDNCGDLPGDYPDSGEPDPKDYCITVTYDSGETEEYRAPPGAIGDEICFEGGTHTICVNGDGVSITRNSDRDDIDSDGDDTNSDGDDIDETPFDEENFDEEDSDCTPPEDVQSEANGEPPKGVDVCEGETEKLKWLIVQVVKEPSSGNVVLYADPANDHIFAGYVAWFIAKQGVKFFLPAIPIRKRNNAFKPPGDVNGYNIYSTNGVKLSIKELKEKVPNA